MLTELFCIAGGGASLSMDSSSEGKSFIHLLLSPFVSHLTLIASFSVTNLIALRLPFTWKIQYRCVMWSFIIRDEFLLSSGEVNVLFHDLVLGVVWPSF